MLYIPLVLQFRIVHHPPSLPIYPDIGKPLKTLNSCIKFIIEKMMQIVHHPPSLPIYPDIGKPLKTLNSCIKFIIEKMMGEKRF